MAERLRVVIAEDHPAVLAELTRILAPHVHVVAVAIDGEDLLRQVGNLLPDVVVTDIAMPRMNGLSACRLIRRAYPAVRIVIVSELLDDDLTAFALELGASTVVRKTEMARELPAACTGALIRRILSLPRLIVLPAGRDDERRFAWNASHRYAARQNR